VSNPLADLLDREAAGLAFARSAFPPWVGAGFADHRHTLHSVGVSYWVALGHHLGYTAVGELPAPAPSARATVGDDIRCDAVWLDRASGAPALLVEYERYEGPTDFDKLQGKADNLLRAYHRWGRPRALVLAYWSKRLLDLPDHDRLRRRFRSGFVTATRERVPGGEANVLFYQFVHREAAGHVWFLGELKRRGET
jgi:hypothetical protein